MRQFIQIIAIIIGLNLAPPSHASNFGNINLLGSYGQPELVSRPNLTTNNNAAKNNINKIMSTANVKPQAVDSSKKNQNITSVAIVAPPIILNQTSTTKTETLSANSKISPVMQYGELDRPLLQKYIIDNKIGGAIVSAKINQNEINSQKSYQKGDLTLTGWAGDMQLGANYEVVYFGMCGQLIAKSLIDQPSPHIAQAVHSNLTKAGFIANLKIENLPRCDNDSVVFAFVQNSENGNLIRLAGNIKLNISGSEIPNEAYSALNVPKLKSQKMQKIDLSQGARPVYSCANEDCPILGYLESFAGDSSSDMVAIIDEKNGWRLIRNQSISGWLK